MQQTLGGWQEFLAGLGQVEPARGPVEQQHAEILLQMLDRQAQCRLGHEQRLCGSGQAAMLGHRDKRTHMPHRKASRRPIFIHPFFS